MPTDPIPLVIFGDAPNQPTGLSRILTDITARAVKYLSGRYDVRTVGWGPWANLPPSGTATPCNAVADGKLVSWPGWVYGDFSTRGTAALATAYRSWFAERRGIVLSVWDPARCEAVATCDLPVAKWGYFAIDAENRNGGLSGPAAQWVAAYNRVLAYTAFGAKVLVTAAHGCDEEGVPHLPHGIDTSIFNYPMTAAEFDRALALLGGGHIEKGTSIVGCVATNQRRKNLGAYMEVLRTLLDMGYQVRGWLHVDRLISESWSVPQLIADCGLAGKVTITQVLTDRELATLYALSTVTIAPGRGEGFGYPIVESLACGTPCVHVDYAGGAEALPTWWRVPPVAYQLEGVYALRRPVLDVAATAAVVARIINARKVQPGQEAVRLFALKYDWKTLWPSWEQWLTESPAP